MRRSLSTLAVSLAAIIGVCFAAGPASAATLHGYYATLEECAGPATRLTIDGHHGVSCQKIPAHYQGKVIGYFWALFSD